MPVLEANGLDLNYAVHDGAGPGADTLILLHGYCASIHMWRHAVPALARAFRVVAYDARGHGRSTAPHGAGHYGLDALCDDLLALMDALEIEQAHLAGHSMGGATVAAFAACHPARVRATLVCNIHAGHQPADPEAEAAERDAYAWKLDHARRMGMSDLCRRQIERGLAPAFVMNDASEMEAYIDRYDRQPLNGYLGTGEALPWEDAGLRAATASLTGPVLFLAGLDDPMHQGAAEAHRALPDSRLVLLENAPHDSVNARPDAFNAELLAFLDDVAEGAPVSGERRR